MKGTPDCIPCLLKRTLYAARAVADDPWLLRKVLDEAMTHLQKAELDRAPAELVTEVMRVPAKVLGTADPFEKVKEGHRLEARALEPSLRARLARSEDPLIDALRLAARANALDAAVFGPVSLSDALGDLEALGPFAVDDIGRAVEGLASVESVLYVCDNAGEILVDRLAIEALCERGKQVTAVVRRSPVVNDATVEDAGWAGLADLCAVVETGTAGCGLPLALVSGDLRERFDAAGLVIAKGSASFQTLDGEPKPKLFLMHVKCDVVARHLGVRLRDTVAYAD